MGIRGGFWDIRVGMMSRDLLVIVGEYVWDGDRWTEGGGWDLWIRYRMEVR